MLMLLEVLGRWKYISSAVYWRCIRCYLHFQVLLMISRVSSDTRLPLGKEVWSHWWTYKGRVSNTIKLGISEVLWWIETTYVCRFYGEEIWWLKILGRSHLSICRRLLFFRNFLACCIFLEILFTHNMRIGLAFRINLWILRSRNISRVQSLSIFCLLHQVLDSITIY